MIQIRQETPEDHWAVDALFDNG
ncbi:hypothetical protein LCGC14_2295140, partial [marine sediment metagenome]